jgi:hypothetical protein
LRPSPPKRWAPCHWRAPHNNEPSFPSNKDMLHQKRILQIYVSGVMFQRYVASVSYRCCKSRSWCCTCYNGYTRMFQVYVLNVSTVLDVCCKYFYLNVAKVDLNVAYTCMLQSYFPSGFRCFIRVVQVFHMHVLIVSFVFFVCCNCSIWMFQSRLWVAHVIRVESGWWRGRRLGWCGPVAVAVARKPEALVCSLARWTGTVWR